MLASQLFLPSASEPCHAEGPAYLYSTTLTSHTRNAQKRRLEKAKHLSVTFSSRVTFTKIVSLHDMGHDQIASVYYNEKDRKECKKDVIMTLRAICRRTPLDPTTQDTRGLEHLISHEVLADLLANKDEALRTVFEAQEAGSSPENIARAYSETTAEAAGRAHRRAKRDAFEATMNQRDWSKDPFAFFKTMNQNGSSLE